MVAVLRLLGRNWWCKCGRFNWWSADVVSSHNSQHLFDPYVFTHFEHGLVLYLLLWALLRQRLGGAQRGLLALALEAGWEIFENTAFIIERYRSATFSLDYYGDSIFNSLGDLIGCLAGFVSAAYLPAVSSGVLFGTIELSLLWFIHDSLLLNLLMLVWPIPALVRWQSHF